ncbi:MAG: C4-dicarboxylate ABC transporter [Desulfobulbus propionicus]|nr:MAG: C4-dicarboxylate ABC transporter [Desulfobulbus propionicus]
MTSTGLIMALALALTMGVVNQALAKKVLLKVPCSVPFSVPILGDDVIGFIADRINNTSQGTIKMKLYEPGKLVPPLEVLDTVSSGKTNAGYTAAFYYAGKNPASVLFSSFPFGPEPAEYIAWYYYGNGLKLYQEMYDHYGYNVKVLPAGIISAETSGWFTKPINSPEDLKGIKMRIAGIGGKVVSKLGVAVTMLPPGEIFQALEKGLIDATEFSQPVCDVPLGFYKVAQYNYFPGWHQPSTVQELLINKDVWNQLNKEQQTLIETTCMAATLRSLALSEGMQGKVLRKNAEQHGVKTMYWSDEMLAAFEGAWKEVAAEEAAKDEMFAKVWKDIQQFRAEYKEWASVGYLPRPEPPTSK